MRILFNVVFGHIQKNLQCFAFIYLRNYPFHEKRLRLLMQSIKNGAGKCGI